MFHTLSSAGSFLSVNMQPDKSAHFNEEKSKHLLQTGCSCSPSSSRFHRFTSVGATLGLKLAQHESDGKQLRVRLKTGELPSDRVILYLLFMAMGSTHTHTGIKSLYILVV